MKPPSAAPHPGPGDRAHRASRNHQMDLLRIAFAAAVLLSHAPEIIDGDSSRELLHRLTHAITFGSFGVDGFFLLSGFLIVKSWQTSPRLPVFLRKRLLRIVPGYLVAVLLSTLILGLAAPAVPHFFAHLGLRFPLSVLLLSSPLTPEVCPGLHYHLVDGTLWTITYEFRCYLLVALFGVLGALRRPHPWLLATFVLLGLQLASARHLLPDWHRLLLLTGDPQQIYRLFFAFFVGGSFYLLRSVIPFRPPLALAAAATLAAALLQPWLWETVLLLCGGYLLFYLTALPLKPLERLGNFPDISYGLYLYGWPVELLLIWFFRLSPWLIFAIALVLSAALGWFSWHYVERPMLKLKPRPSAPLPG